MRDYSKIDNYLNVLSQDIYPQPPDPLHEEFTKNVIDLFFPLKFKKYYKNKSVLDVGCGQGISAKYFLERNMEWTGITLGTDYNVCRTNGLTVFQEDFSFLPFEDRTFSTIFARHSLEHSPFPLLTLMEWWRVAKRYLVLVLPSPRHFKYFGKNHYSVMTNSHALWLTARAGWKPLHKDFSEEQELRYIFTKSLPQIENMWDKESVLEEEYNKHVEGSVNWNEFT